MDQVHALVQLQEHDLALARLERELDEMPEKRAILAARAKIGDIEKLKARTDAAVYAIDAASRATEDKIATVKGKMDAEQAKLVSGEVSNPKELQAVSMELDSLRRRVEALESDLLGQMQKREDGAAQVAKIEAALTEGHRREAELTARFKEHGGDIVAHIEAERRARSVAAAATGAELLQRYESTRASRHGIGVGVLSEGRCSACRVGLPAGKVAALEQGPDVSTCPSCGRILIVRGL
jgi:predicted  nucleic acid-binding Zn-ribbon protein